MRILIGGVPGTVGQVFLLLKKSEAVQMRHELEQLLAASDYDHGDVVDPESGHMITMQLYGSSDSPPLTERLRRADELDE